MNESALSAVAYCHLGSSRAPRPESEAAFQVALANGLLAHDPVWRATERGIGALIGGGLLAGEPAPGLIRLHVLWAQHGPDDPSRFWPQFVAAFTDGFVDAWPEGYQRDRERAEAEYRGMVDDQIGPYSVARFFVTVIETPRPAVPEAVA